MKALVAIDDTKESWDAVEFARRILHEDDHVWVLNVAHRLSPPSNRAAALPSYGASALSGNAAFAMEATEPENERVRAANQTSEAQAERAVGEAAQVLGAEGQEVRFGEPAARIVEMARRHEVDLIITGTHDPGAVRRLFFGSVSRDVVNKAPCSVLVVR